MLIIVQKSTGKIIQMMDGAANERMVECLTQNAIGWGYTEADIEVREPTEEEKLQIGVLL